MQTYNDLLAVETNKLIDVQIDRLRDQLSFNQFTDVWQFKYIMGAIDGLRTAQTLMEESKQLADQSNR
jgi:hypothetical protein